jgi:hypothetical protein
MGCFVIMAGECRPRYKRRRARAHPCGAGAGRGRRIRGEPVPPARSPTSDPADRDLRDDEPARIAGVVKALDGTIEGVVSHIRVIDLEDRYDYLVETTATAFVVEDDSGSVIVDPQGADVELPTVARPRGSTPRSRAPACAPTAAVLHRGHPPDRRWPSA